MIRTLRIIANGFDFAVDEAGDGDRLALCLHGFPESRFSWRYQLPFLAELGYRAWAPDLRGYGRTKPKPQATSAYVVDRLMEDVAALIDASKARHVVLIGHDWGGIIAWTFATNRVRELERLVIMNVPHPALLFASLRHNWRQRLRSWYMFLFQLPRLAEWYLSRNDARAIRHAVYDMAVDKSNFTPDVLDRYAQDAQRPCAITPMVNSFRTTFRRKGKMAGPWPVIDTPTLVVWGEADTALGIEVLEGTNTYVRDLTIRRLPKVSHWLQQEAPAKVNAILREWLLSPH